MVPLQLTIGYYKKFSRCEKLWWGSNSSTPTDNWYYKKCSQWHEKSWWQVAKNKGKRFRNYTRQTLWSIKTAALLEKFHCTYVEQMSNEKLYNKRLTSRLVRRYSRGMSLTWRIKAEHWTPISSVSIERNLGRRSSKACMLSCMHSERKKKMTQDLSQCQTLWKIT